MDFAMSRFSAQIMKAWVDANPETTLLIFSAVLIPQARIALGNILISCESGIRI